MATKSNGQKPNALLGSLRFFYGYCSSRIILEQASSKSHPPKALYFSINETPVSICDIVSIPQVMFLLEKTSQTITNQDFYH